MLYKDTVVVGAAKCQSCSFRFCGFRDRTKSCCGTLVPLGLTLALSPAQVFAYQSIITKKWMVF